MSYGGTPILGHELSQKVLLYLSQDGSCQSIFIPDCVDRNVYCSNVTSPANSTKSILVPTASNGLSILGTSFKFICPQNFFFNYSLPKNFTSFYYATNVNSSTVTCNKYG